MTRKKKSKTKYQVGQWLWILAPINSSFQCETCGGGGLIYHEKTDSRSSCPDCLASGRFEGIRTHLQGPERVRSIWTEGDLTLYDLGAAGQWTEALLYHNPVTAVKELEKINKAEHKAAKEQAKDGAHS